MAVDELLFVKQMRWNFEKRADVFETSLKCYPLQAVIFLRAVSAVP